MRALLTTLEKEFVRLQRQHADCMQQVSLPLAHQPTLLLTRLPSQLAEARAQLPRAREEVRAAIAARDMVILELRRTRLMLSTLQLEFEKRQK